LHRGRLRKDRRPTRRRKLEFFVILLFLLGRLLILSVREFFARRFFHGGHVVGRVFLPSGVRFLVQRGRLFQWPGRNQRRPVIQQPGASGVWGRRAGGKRSL
jgi:hypothetical protein